MSHRLWELAGLDKAPEVELTDGDVALTVAQPVWASLVEEGELWIRAGCPPPEWWDQQAPVEKLALAEAGERVWASRAATIGAAAQSPEAAAAVLAKQDGGRAQVHQRLAAAASRAASRAAGKEVSG